MAKLPRGIRDGGERQVNAIRNFFHDLTLRPQGVTIVIAAFLPIIAAAWQGED